ncbi:DegT/DnrJ/EryC1/StrS family aminotransferase [Olleya namhaensis]|uniref:DegT/DnrJ/EryC1/StrS family aminotransferase n=1 Tax=Olleya namhaensis TaxID=1144750 RepID=UPI002492A642|nr:aminotransferase class I/II-fold pyridoxal phosphate-dependent enzyme [Olleya namhaensis]
MNTKIWLSSPHMGGTEEKYVKEAFDTNWIAPLGPNVTAFEKALESYLQNNVHIACLSSGTAAIHLALIQLNVSTGDEVLCQSFTFCGTTNPIAYVGAKPVFVDSELDTWNMCPQQLEIAIKDRIEKGKKPKAIILVHLYGMPAKMDEILAISSKYEIPLIEDAAEALGSKYKGRKCGTFGAFSILSFNGNKIITTSGGGALVTRTIEEKEKTIFYSTQARDKANHYQHSEIGYNYRMSNISAGIGRGQMEVLDKHIALRIRNNNFYKSLFKSIEGITVFSEMSSDYSSNHWLSCIIFDEKKSLVTKDDLFNELAKNNIESRPLWKPMHMQPINNNSMFYGEGNCEFLFNNGLCLPSGSNLKEEDLERIERIVRKTFNV